MANNNIRWISIILSTTLAINWKIAGIDDNTSKHQYHRDIYYFSPVSHFRGYWGFDLFDRRIHWISFDRRSLDGKQNSPTWNTDFPLYISKSRNRNQIGREPLRRRSLRLINSLIIHHSASSHGNVEEFRKEHIAKGWNDIGYHDVITNGNGGLDGHIHPGRPHDQVGAAVFGNNTGKLHVCLVGNFHKGDKGYTGLPTKSQMYALGHWLFVNGAKYGISRGKKLDVFGHKEVTIRGHQTACPGNQFPLLIIRDWYDANIWKTRSQNKKEIYDFISLSGFLDENEYWSHR